MEDLEQFTKDLQLQSTTEAPETETISIPDIAQAVAQVPAPQEQKHYDICPICGNFMCTAWMNASPATRAVMLMEVRTIQEAARAFRTFDAPPTMFLDDYV